MSREVQAIGDWTTNAQMMADVARLGYLDGTVLDATYGEGGFWTVWRPRCLVTNDLYKPAQFQESYRAFPFEDGRFDVVVFDPPYKLRGTPALGEQDERYGTTERMSRDDVMDDIRLGAIECYRVTNRWLHVKVMDQVEGGRKRWQTIMVANAIIGLGGILWDRFDIGTAGRPQPGERTQRTSRTKHSTLLVFRKGRGS